MNSRGEKSKKLKQRKILKPLPLFMIPVWKGKREKFYNEIKKIFSTVKIRLKIIDLDES